LGLLRWVGLIVLAVVAVVGCPGIDGISVVVAANLVIAYRAGQCVGAIIGCPGVEGISVVVDAVLGGARGIWSGGGGIVVVPEEALAGLLDEGEGAFIDGFVFHLLVSFAEFWR
jgi:hypothetical protein